MTEEQARQKAIELIRGIYYPNMDSNLIDDDFILLNFCDEYNWFMQGWKETMESLKTVPKRCPKCNSESVILFDSDNDICNECGNLC